MLLSASRSVARRGGIWGPARVGRSGSTGRDRVFKSACVARRWAVLSGLRRGPPAEAGQASTTRFRGFCGELARARGMDCGGMDYKPDMTIPARIVTRMRMPRIDTHSPPLPSTGPKKLDQDPRSAACLDNCA